MLLKARGVLARLRDALVRRLGPLLPDRVKEAAWRAYGFSDRFWILLARLRGESRPIPPLELRYRVGHPSIAGFLTAGELWTEALEKLARDASVVIDSKMRILDFGCGPGKVVANLAARSGGPVLAGCDLHQNTIDWLQQAIPDGHFVVNDFSPPLAFENREFDLIYAWSVFTHLHEDAQFAWLAELARVSAPSSTLFLSFNGLGHDGLRVPRLHDRFDLEELQRTGFAFAVEETSDPERWHGTSETYGDAAHTFDYIRAEWGRFFEVRDIVPAGLAGVQDVAVLRPLPPR